MSDLINLIPKNSTDRLPGLKTNVTVWLVYSTETFHKHMDTELSQCRNLTLEHLFFEHINNTSMEQLTVPDLLFVEASGNWASQLGKLQQFDFGSDNHQAALIIFGNESDNSSLKTALRIGASDFLSNSATIAELYPILKMTAEEKLANRQYGELCLFINSKGGAGATTLALNTATDLANAHPNKVIILDLDYQYEVITEYLNIVPKYSLLDVLDNLNDLDESSLNGLVTKHDSGLHILSFQRNERHESQEKMELLGKLILTLRQYYPYVIIDLSKGIDAFADNIVTPATQLFIVTQQNLVSLKHTNLILHDLQMEYGVSMDRIEVLVNRFDKRQSIKLKDIADTLPNHVNIRVIPNDFKVVIESANLGKPLMEVNKKSQVAKALAALSRHIGPQKEVKESWFKRLFS
ncbi:AAA family ATPase [Aliivibrio kagoshimensis]|jgi:pilus assembly protein CpaE|uniref:AAA family ATPase n=1 Tax=Aliivibrio kagoshimensis TaxID=2910230 RepID=UPI003D0B5402